MFASRFLRAASVLCLVGCLSFLFPRSLSAGDKHKKKLKSVTGKLSEFFTGDVPPLELTPDKFEAKWGKFFKWLEKGKKEGARFQEVNTMKKLTLFDSEVWEAVVRFKNGKFDRIDVSLYNRGDAESSVIVT